MSPPSKIIFSHRISFFRLWRRERLKEQTTLSWSEVIYLIAAIFALWRALPLLVPVGNYLEEIYDFWEGICEPVIDYLI